MRRQTRELAAALRSFLRFLHVEGFVSVPLAQAVPPVAFRKGAGLPRWLAPQIVTRLLASCDRRTGRGRRTTRSCWYWPAWGCGPARVARMSLDDIDWRAGELVVHGKGRREDRLPLPPDVGEALVAYLRRGRPETDAHGVPPGHRSPGRPERSCHNLGRHLGVRAGRSTQSERPPAPPLVGHPRATHRWIHREGPGQILRHELVGTTQIYAKVDFAALASLCSPAGRCGMTTTPTLRTSLADYLAVRRSLGYKLERAGLLLEQFVSFCELAGGTRITRG